MAPLTVGLSALSSVARLASSTGHVTPVAARQAPGTDFASFLSGAASSSARSVADAELAGMAALQGKISTREVVDRLMQAEQQLQIALAIRDKTITAVQEISRMAI